MGKGNKFQKIRQMLHRYGDVLSLVAPQDYRALRSRYGGENSNRVPKGTCENDYKNLCQLLNI